MLIIYYYCIMNWKLFSSAKEAHMQPGRPPRGLGVASLPAEVFNVGWDFILKASIDLVLLGLFYFLKSKAYYDYPEHYSCSSFACLPHQVRDRRQKN